jgi:hypothetical protein
MATVSLFSVRPLLCKATRRGLVEAGFGVCCDAAYIDNPWVRTIAKAANQACGKGMTWLSRWSCL